MNFFHKRRVQALAYQWKREREFQLRMEIEIEAAPLLDLLFLNIQTYPGRGVMCLDEVGIFKNEEIEPALSILRDSGVPIILAFQNFAQLEENYGVPRKRSILSNPGTKIHLARGWEGSRGSAGPDQRGGGGRTTAGIEIRALVEARPSSHLFDGTSHH